MGKSVWLTEAEGFEEKDLLSGLNSRPTTTTSLNHARTKNQRNMCAKTYETEEQLHWANLPLVPAPNVLTDATAPHQSSTTSSRYGAYGAGGLQVPESETQNAYCSRSRPKTHAPGALLHPQRRSTTEQSHVTAKSAEEPLRRYNPVAESEGNSDKLSQPPLRFLPLSEPAFKRSGQDKLALAGHASSDAVFLSAAEQLEEIARSFRQREATAVGGKRNQASHATQLAGQSSRKESARSRAPGHKRSHTQGTSDVHHVATSIGVAGYGYMTAPVQRVMSPTISLDGLYAKFLDVYLPRNRKGDTATAVLSLLIATPTVLPSPVAALEEAVRTLVLVSLGGATGNDVLLQQAVKHYGKALSSLRRSIGHPQLTNYEHAFVAIVILLLCSHHTKIRTVDDGWVQHLWGAQHYLIARNSGSFQTKAGALALALARHASLSYSLLARKASIFAKSGARGSAPIDPQFRTNWSDLLFTTSLQIPTLLARHDVIMLSKQADRERMKALDAACSGVELRLRAWLREWTAVHTTIGVAVFKERSIDCFSSFTSLCRDRTFPYAYWFEDFSYAFLAVWYCVSMHHILQTRISLEALRKELANDAAAKIDSSAYQLEAHRLVRDICMCFPYLCEDQCGMSGYIAMLLPLRVVTAYFQKQESREYLQWTDEVRRTVFVKGVTPPNATYQRPR